jgi:hypothetical protein
LVFLGTANAVRRLYWINEHQVNDVGN